MQISTWGLYWGHSSCAVVILQVVWPIHTYHLLPYQLSGCSPCDGHDLSGTRTKTQDTQYLEIGNVSSDSDSGTSRFERRILQTSLSLRQTALMSWCKDMNPSDKTPSNFCMMWRWSWNDITKLGVWQLLRERLGHHIFKTWTQWKKVI